MARTRPVCRAFRAIRMQSCGVVAIGFTIIYNTTGIINFAQGEFLMIGGMTAVTLQRHVPLPLAILGAVDIEPLVGARVV